MLQKIVSGYGSIKGLSQLVAQAGAKKALLVCDSSFPFLSIKEDVLSLQTPYVTFSDFTPNPLYEDVKKGVELFLAEDCDAIVAVGGGSAIDVAKCIKLYCKMNGEENYLLQEYKDSGIPLIAIPTTAGTGSESTRYAVIYYEGKKQSVTHESIVPNFVVLEPSVLKTLPVYQKKCTMLDALCQGIEAWWSVNSTEESKQYSKRAIAAILANYKGYIFEQDERATQEIMLASNYAGKAINITQTTAAHAMSYKLTSMYKLPHGHAVAVCLPRVWAYMQAHSKACIDPRGEAYLTEVFAEIAGALGCATAKEGVDFFFRLLEELGLDSPATANGENLEVLTASVNPVRLKNNPVQLTEETLYRLYREIVKVEG